MRKIFSTIFIGFSTFITFITNGQSWSPPVVIEPISSAVGNNGNVGIYSSLFVVNGNPAMSYYDGTHGNLMYIRATDISGTTWGTPIIIDASGDVGAFSCLIVVNDFPTICYYAGGAFNDLRYVRANDASGTSWGAPITLDASGDIGTFAKSMKIVSGNPAIVYRDNSNKDLKYIRATDISGTTWSTPITIQSIGNIGEYSSLNIINGFPAIAYLDYTVGVKYIRALDASGATWDTPILLEAGNLGAYVSLQVINGNPALSYYDQTLQDLKYIRATDISGGTWGSVLTVASAGNSGAYSTLQVVNGNPAIAYIDGSSSILKYIRATDVSGSAWASPVTADGSINTGTCYTLQIVNGSPAVCYYDYINHTLKYKRASDANGATWPAQYTIGGSGDFGLYNSLQIINGNPALSFYDNSGYNLKYTRATDATGTSWTPSVFVDITGDVGQYSSLQVTNGNPAIAYFDATNLNLKFARATNATGTAWGTPIVIDAIGDVGKYLSLQIINGNPAISYFDDTNGDLKFVMATNMSGTTWSTPISVDATVASVGQYTSLQSVNGLPAISYYDVTNGNLNYIIALDASGTTWNAPIILDATGDIGQYSSLQIVNGNPAIAYYDVTNGNLKYIRSTDITGSTWNTPIVLQSINDVGQFASMQIINGNPAVSYYTGSAILDLSYVRANDINGNLWGTPVSVYAPSYTGRYTSMIPIGTQVGIAFYNMSESAPYFILGDTPLPVDFIELNANYSSQLNSITISWKTTNEFNNDYFEVLKSKDGVNFTSIGNINGKGTFNTISLYSFIDLNISHEFNYYKIKQVDLNGTESYSPIVNVEKKQTSLYIYPNPTTGVVKFIGFAINDEITISNQIGTALLHLKISSSTESVDLSSYPKGIYFIQNRTNNYLNYFKIIVE